MSDTVLDSRGAFVVSVRALAWADPTVLRNALTSIDLAGLSPGPVTPHEAMFHAMSDVFGTGHTVQALPKGAGGLVVLRFVTSNGGTLKEGIPVYANITSKNGLDVEVIHDPENHDDEVQARYLKLKELVSPGRLVATVRKYAVTSLKGAHIDNVVWLPARVLPQWQRFTAAFRTAAPTRINTVSCAVDEETAKAVIDHVTAARLKEATAIAEKLRALDPVRQSSGAEILALSKQARKLEAQVGLDETDLGTTLNAVRECLQKAKLANMIGTIQSGIANVDPSESGATS